MKQALITGITGQDGARAGTDNCCEIYSTYRRPLSREYLDVFDKVNLIPADLKDTGSRVRGHAVNYPVSAVVFNVIATYRGDT